MRIRPAVAADLADCQAIYAFHVLHGTGSFETAPPSLEELAARHAGVVGAGYAWLVATDATGVVGFAYYAAFRARAAYRHTVEDSVYVRETARGRGVGRALLAALLDQARQQDFREMLALVGDAENRSSIAVHASLGFIEVGVMRRVGQKFGRWLDVVTMQKTLGRD